MRADLAAGFVEEIETRLLRLPKRPLRDSLEGIEDLAQSIQEKGLLQPIVVRPVEGAFEIVAGNRRFAACRYAGMRKVTCNVLSLSDKEAYEVSLVENVQHRSLNPIEEAQAFKKYVDVFGYGGESELAIKIGKSQQYISQRIRLLTLPRSVLGKVTRRLVSPSDAAELLGLGEEDQRLVSDLIVSEGLSSRTVRRLARDIKQEDPFAPPAPISGGERHVLRIIDKSIAFLRTSLIRLDDMIDQLHDEDWILNEILADDRKTIHKQIDTLIRLRVRLNRNEALRAL